MKSARAKVLHPLLGRPLGFYAIQRALQAGASPVVAVVGHQAKQVEESMAAAFPGAPLTFALQAEQLGTAHAVGSARQALESFSGEVFILYGDVPMVETSTLKALAALKHKRRAALALVTTRPESPVGYGRIIREGGEVARIVEQKDCSRAEAEVGEVNAGIYLVDSGFLFDSLARVRSSNAQSEFYLTDLVALARAGGHGVTALEAPPQEVAGVNDQLELSRAAAAMRDRINGEHLRAGVAMADPATTWIEESVKLAGDVSIAPGCSLRGTTAVAAGASIGAGCILTDAQIGASARLEPYCVVEASQVGRGASIGPFARLRAGTELGEEAHLGNFVETKKARIGKGSKAGHLAYLGDCEIGKAVNVGAGTITCNYDGEKKHQTTIGDGVFIGSDSQLVAPVNVGKNAIIGAGSCIVEDVPADSLAIARSRQVNKKDYAKKRRAG